jgi:hypothetical protein
VCHLSAPAPPSPRFASIEVALFFPAALFLLQKTLFFPAALFLLQKTLFFPAALFFVQKAPFLTTTLFLLQKTHAFPVQFWLAVPKCHVHLTL